MVLGFVPLWKAASAAAALTTTTTLLPSTPWAPDANLAITRISIRECSPIKLSLSPENHSRREKSLSSATTTTTTTITSSSNDIPFPPTTFFPSRREGLIQCFKTFSWGVVTSSCMGQISCHPLPAEASSTKLVTIYDKAATTYDELYGQSQVGKTLDLNEVRRTTLSFASGNVLELGVGTGLNLPYYPSPKKKNDTKDDDETSTTAAITSLTAVDLSPEMLSRAKQKQNLLPNSISTSQVTFQVGDASQLPFESNTFDTVIDTFGLCVFEDPVLVLNEAYRVLKPNGLLLLAETDDSLPSRILGSARINDVSRTCRPDDNVLGLIQKVGRGSSSGFEIVQTETYAGGMFRRVVARKQTK